jgi:hypothetical protein
MSLASHSVLCRGLLFFWSAWFSVVFSTNLADGLRQAGLLPTGWRFTSGNFQLINQSIGIYSLQESWAAILFGAVVLVQLGAAMVFWRAFLDRDTVTKPDNPKVLQAFVLGIGLFAAFLVADEFFVVYDRLSGLETTHLLVLCGLLLSYLVIHVLSGHRQPA